MKIAAYRAMRRGGLDILPVAAKLARDPDAGVRREVALSLRDKPADASLDILVEIARGYDGQDRTYLEALGTGATEEGSRALRSPSARPRVPSIRSRGPSVRLDRVAPAPAGRGRGFRRPRARGEAVGR